MDVMLAQLAKLLGNKMPSACGKVRTFSIDITGWHVKTANVCASHIQTIGHFR